MASENKILYIKGSRDVEVTKPDVTLGDLLSMESTDKLMLAKVRTLKIVRFKKSGRQRCVVSLLKIIACIHGEFPQADIQNLGETDIIVTYEDQKTPAFAWHIIKTVFVAAVTFFGAAFSIMAFNNDVDVTKLFGQIYELMTGQETNGYTVLEIAYSVGVTAGILIFFNHFGKSKVSVDPTPLEVEMRLYENDIQTTLIENYSRNSGNKEDSSNGKGSKG